MTQPNPIQVRFDEIHRVLQSADNNASATKDALQRSCIECSQLVAGINRCVLALTAAEALHVSQPLQACNASVSGLFDRYAARLLTDQVTLADAAAFSAHRVFMSHAGEDKLLVVGVLSDAIERFVPPLSPFVDQFHIMTSAVSCRRAIDTALVAARFVVFHLTPSFVSKDWPLYELFLAAALDRARGRRLRQVTTVEVTLLPLDRVKLLHLPLRTDRNASLPVVLQYTGPRDVVVFRQLVVRHLGDLACRIDDSGSGLGSAFGASHVFPDSSRCARFRIVFVHVRTLSAAGSDLSLANSAQIAYARVRCELERLGLCSACDTAEDKVCSVEFHHVQSWADVRAAVEAIAGVGQVLLHLTATRPAVAYASAEAISFQREQVSCDQVMQLPGLRGAILWTQVVVPADVPTNGMQFVVGVHGALPCAAAVAVFSPALLVHMFAHRKQSPTKALRDVVTSCRTVTRGEPSLQQVSQFAHAVHVQGAGCSSALDASDSFVSPLQPQLIAVSVARRAAPPASADYVTLEGADPNHLTLLALDHGVAKRLGSTDGASSSTPAQRSACISAADWCLFDLPNVLMQASWQLRSQAFVSARVSPSVVDRALETAPRFGLCATLECSASSCPRVKFTFSS